MQPMPTEKELDEYYENLYWNDRSIVEGVFQRCLDHYILIRDLAPDFFLGRNNDFSGVFVVTDSKSLTILWRWPGVTGFIFLTAIVYFSL